MTGIDPKTRQKAKALRADMTPQERRLWFKLREVNRMLGTHFRRQAAVGRYIADFAEFRLRLVIEVDGGQHGPVRDQLRDGWFRAEGFEVLRVWNSDVDGNLDGVMQVVLDQIEARRAAVGNGAPPPHPSPTRGEGGAFPAPSGATVDRGTSPPPRGEGMGEGGSAFGQETTP